MLRVEERGFKGDSDPKRQVGYLAIKPAHKQKLGAHERKCRDERKEMSTCLIDYTTWLLSAHGATD